MFMIKILAKLLKVLNSETDPSQISLAFAFSIIAGLTPILSLHNLLVIFLVLFIRVNLSSFLLGLMFFSGLAYILDPIFHWIGITMLTAANLERLWTTLYNSSLWRLEKFNNSIMMGSLLFSLLVFIPFHFIVRRAIINYREHILEWVQKTKVMQLFKASKFFSIYQSLS
jgi:uncharacterized protein (TIGR03546 family)